jgi:NAD(P)-dependent dehydrogenase (short-subunit alcohol dehydrogenase family)
MAAYNAAKAAVTRMTKSVVPHCAKQGAASAAILFIWA